VGMKAMQPQSDALVRPDEVTQEIPIADGDVGVSPKQWFRRRNIVVTAVVVVVVAGAGIGIWLGTSSSAAPALQITTQTVSATTGTMKQTVSTSGTIAPAQQANLNFGVSGSVTAVNVSAGQTVTAGQTLATVDPAALQATVSAAQSSLTAAQAKLSSDQSAGASSSQIASDQASVTTAQSQLTSDQTNLANASLTSTITGTVASVGLSVGQQVSSSSTSSNSGSGTSSGSGNGSSSGGGSSSSAGGGLSGAGGSSSGASSSAASSSAASSSSSSSSSSSTAQVVVISTNSFVVNATVDDTQVGQIKQGQQVVITPSGSTTNVYGTVSSVGLIATQSSTVATFPVAIAVTGNPTGIYAGSTATLSVIVKQLNNVVEVPTAAISYSGGQSTVTVVQNGSHVSRAVTTGVSSNGQTQITSGLTSGEKVLEQVVKFNGTAGGAGRSLFGGTGGAGGAGGAGGLGGAGRFRGGAGGFGGGGGGGAVGG
jgi:membrane fusion protein, macrolide-specific efflux system